MSGRDYWNGIDLEGWRELPGRLPSLRGQKGLFEEQTDEEGLLIEPIRYVSKAQRRAEADRKQGRLFE